MSGQPEGSAPAPGSAQPAGAPQPEGPAGERTVMLVDAVVAIAMTLLALPLVDLALEVEYDGPADLWSQIRDLVIPFAISFLVIYLFWRANVRIFRRLAESGAPEPPGLALLAVLWLMAVALLPFTTALVGQSVDTTSAPLYVGSMLVLSLLTWASTVVVDRAAGLTPALVGWATSAAFAGATLVAVWAPDAGLYLLLLLIPIRLAEVRMRRRGRLSGD